MESLTDPDSEEESPIRTSSAQKRRQETSKILEHLDAPELTSSPPSAKRSKTTYISRATTGDQPSTSGHISDGASTSNGRLPNATANRPGRYQQEDAFDTVQPEEDNQDLSHEKEHGAEIDDDKDQQMDPRDCWNVRQSRRRKIRSFRADADEYEIGFVNECLLQLIHNRGDVVVAFNEIIDDLLEHLMSDFALSDMVGVEIQQPDLKADIFVPVMRRDQMNADRVFGIIERVMQSNKAFTLGADMTIKIIRVKDLEGGIPPVLEQDDFATVKRSVITITNRHDKMCLARAIVTGIAHHEYKTGKSVNWNNIRRGQNEQTKRASDLHKRADVAPGRCGLEEVDRFEKYLQGYRLVIVTREKTEPILHMGSNVDGIPIFLYFHDEHFDTITSMGGFMNQKYFCTICFKPYKHPKQHSCIIKCSKCRTTKGSPCKHEDGNWHCEKCNCDFMNATCLKNHRIGAGSTCDTYKCCRLCNIKYDSSHKHECGMFFCSTCTKKQPKGHRCYMQPLQKAAKSVNCPSYIFFDFESQVAEEDGRHVPNFAVAHKVCSDCVDIEDITINCPSGCTRQKIFFGENTVKDFCDWACKYPETIFLAHNLKGYDGHFIVEHFTKCGMPPKPILTSGLKILSMEFKLPRISRNEPVKKIVFKDSSNFIPMKLANFPKTFGLKENKGYFPYLFNTKANEDYIGPWPEANNYHPESMNSDEKHIFETWYANAKQEGKKFNMAEEIKKYCIADVDLLRKGCLEFRRIFISMTKVDPFKEAITLPQACLKVFRQNFLKEDTIAIGNLRGYDNHSHKAMQWIERRSVEDNVRIQHARNGGEARIDGYKVDGLSEGSPKTVYEFHGCVWHGCPKCYPNRNTRVPRSHKTMEEMHRKTMCKTKHLESKGFKVVEMWECDFDRQIKSDHEMKNINCKPSLNPRDAFFGGRTNATCLKYEVKANEKIRYIDVCSLYPWVNKYGRYPIGHPKFITENILNWKEYEGLVYCRVLPPRGLLHPVLPYRSNGLLLFPLCRTCADERLLEQCEHNDDQRAIEGTWVTLELNMADKMGYKILKVYEVWHFTQFTQYDTETHTGGLFSGYIDTFLKMKQEAEGWPFGYETEEERQAYIDKYKEHEGIALENINKNEGRRCLAKLMLNSLWGKFGQRNNLPNKEIINDMRQFWKLVNDPSKEVKINRIDESGMEITYTQKDGFIEEGRNTNIFIAAYTTAQARLKLYDYLKLLGDRVLYFDTDSIIYVSRDGQDEPALGNYLGDMTDELVKDYGKGSFITRFVSGGPKNYAYEVYSTDRKAKIQNCKVRGVTLTADVSKYVNFSTMETLLNHLDQGRDGKGTVFHTKQNIVRKSLGHIYSKPKSMTYRLVYTKRVVKNDFKTIPYGY